LSSFRRFQLYALGLLRFGLNVILGCIVFYNLLVVVLALLWDLLQIGFLCCVQRTAALYDENAVAGVVSL